MVRSESELLANNVGNLAHRGTSPIHRSLQKLIDEFLPGANFTPSLKKSLTLCMLCQKGEQLIGAEEKSSAVLYFALRSFSQSRLEFSSLKILQIHFAINAMFIKFVFITPKPPWHLG
jgi:hypothetical protein